MMADGCKYLCEQTTQTRYKDPAHAPGDHANADVSRQTTTRERCALPKLYQTSETCSTISLRYKRTRRQKSTIYPATASCARASPRRKQCSHRRMLTDQMLLLGAILRLRRHNCERTFLSFFSTIAFRARARDARPVSGSA